MGHQWPTGAAQQVQKITNQGAMCRFARDDRFKNMSITNLLDATDRALSFESLNDGLDRGVCRALFLGQPFLDFAHRSATQAPQ